MKRSLLKILLTAVPLLAASGLAAASPEIGRHTTPAGHSFWYVPLEEAKRTAVAVTWAAGLPTGPDVHEATARLGVSLMLSGGADGIGSDELAADFEDLDSSSRIWVQPGEVRGFMVAPEDSLQEAAEIVNLWLAKPDFEERWLEREKRTLLRNVRVRGETAAGTAWNLARQILIDDHPYNRFWSIAPADEIKTIDRDDIAAWHRGSFGTGDLTITAAGSAPADAVGRAIDAALAGLPSSPNREPLSFAGPDVKPGTVVLHDPESPKSLIMAFGPLAPPTAEDSPALGLATAILGSGQQSRLFRAMRTDLRAAYGFRAGINSFTRKHRLLRMGGEVETTLLPEALQAMRETYEQFRTEGIAEDEFTVTRDLVQQRISEGMKRPTRVANRLMSSRLRNRPDGHFETTLERVAALESDTVNAEIRDALPAFDEFLTLVVTPDPSALEGACVITQIEEWRRCFVE